MPLPRDRVVSPGAFVFVHAAPPELRVLEDWPGIKSILAVEAMRMIKPHGAVTAEKRYVLSSMPAADERQVAAIRQHWSRENRLHARVGGHLSGRCFPCPGPAGSAPSGLAREKSRSICSTTVQPRAVSEANENRPLGMMPLWPNCLLVQGCA